MKKQIRFSHDEQSVRDAPKLLLPCRTLGSDWLWVTGARLGASMALGMLSLCSALAESPLGDDPRTVSISGQYTYISTNAVPPETNTFHFVSLTIGANKWNLSATNVIDPREWSRMWCDGTNIYTVQEDKLNGYRLFAYIYPGQIFAPQSHDAAYLFFPWMVLHLTPQLIQESKRDGKANTLAPWGSRDGLLDFGFKWRTSYSDDGAIESIDVVRDSTLDLKTDEAELRRETLDYPFTADQRERRLNKLWFRKQFPDGFIRARYECDYIPYDGGRRIPTYARFSSYFPISERVRNKWVPKPGRRMVDHLMLEVQDVKLFKSDNMKTPGFTMPGATTVNDYRYQRANDRTKFNRAVYTLKADDVFPLDGDSKLLSEAEKWLKSGPRYDSLVWRRVFILSGMFGVIVIPLIVSRRWWSSKFGLNGK